MPHCGDCLRFYPSIMPSGCPFCDTKRYYTTPYCQFCHKKHDVPEVGPDQVALRPMCPECGNGPLLPSSKELNRRMTLDVSVLPFVATKQDVEKALMESAEPVKVDGEILGQVSIRRTQGPVELFVQSYKIEQYMKTVSLAFHGEKEMIGSLNDEGMLQLKRTLGVAQTGNPFSGLKYYKIPATGEAFYNTAGTFQFCMRGFGHAIYPPGVPGGHNTRDLSLFQAVGLGEGVTFKYPIVASDPGLLNILNETKEGMVAFYANYMRPVTHNVIIAIRQESPKKEEADPLASKKSIFKAPTLEPGDRPRTRRG